MKFCTIFDKKCSSKVLKNEKLQLFLTICFFKKILYKFICLANY